MKNLLVACLLLPTSIVSESEHDFENIQESTADNINFGAVLDKH